MNFLKTLVAAGLVAASTVPVRALDISGAGATFPYPIYAKWADSYKKETGNGMNYQSIGSGGGSVIGAPVFGSICVCAAAVTTFGLIKKLMPSLSGSRL